MKILRNTVHRQSSKIEVKTLVAGIQVGAIRRLENIFNIDGLQRRNACYKNMNGTLRWVWLGDGPMVHMAVKDCLKALN